MLTQNNDIQNDAHNQMPGEDDQDALTLAQFTQYVQEINNQPPWRSVADREMDYYDGNQLDAEILQKQAAIGMPPAIEPLIGPAIDAVLGFEAKTRTDWRVLPDADKEGDDVADALNHKLNQAERHSKADKACSEAYKSQVSVGLGWVEVARESNPFKYPYRCQAIHRNEIWYDWLACGDVDKMRYMIRRRWTDKDQAALQYPEQAELIRSAARGWTGLDMNSSMDGGTSTDLAMSYAAERGWSIEEMQWRDVESRRVCLFEVWYRVWKRVAVMTLPDGRVVEVDIGNPVHVAALASGAVVPKMVVVPKMRRAIWMGPHRLDDGPTPYKHQKFPYVPFIGVLEDRTMKPYGLIRGMMYQQDAINAGTGKIRWGLAAVRTVRTKGAVMADDEAFRQQVARIDADIILDAAHMAKPGAKFEVDRDFQLNEQQYKMLADARLAIERSSRITSAFQGKQGTARSGVQESTQVEQSVQALADMNDNFATARAEVGDLLLSLIIEDTIGKQETITIDGKGLKPDRTIALNVPTQAEDGFEYLDNDVERTKIKVTLGDVPSTPTFRAQQLGALSEAFKSLPEKYQPIVLPHLLALMDVPDKRDIIEGIKNIDQQQTPEQIQALIEQAVKNAGLDLKRMEIERRYPVGMDEAKETLIRAQAVDVGVRAAFAAIQTGGAIVAQPAIAPVADVVMQNAGFRLPNPAGQDPNFPQPMPQLAPGIVPTGIPPAQTNTSPMSPPVPQQPGAPGSALRGIETQRQEGAPTGEPA